MDIWEERKVFGSRAKSLKEVMLGEEVPPPLELSSKKRSRSVKVVKKDSRSTKTVSKKAFFLLLSFSFIVFVG